MPALLVLRPKAQGLVSVSQALSQLGHTPSPPFPRILRTF